MTRIVETPGVCGGQPRIDGTRIPVSAIVRQWDDGRTDDELLADYPDLTQADLDAVRVYTADAMTRVVKLTIELDLTYDGMSGVHRRDIIAAVDDYLEGSFQESLKKGLGALATPARIGLRIRPSEGKMG